MKAMMAIQAEVGLIKSVVVRRQSAGRAEQAQPSRRGAVSGRVFQGNRAPTTQSAVSTAVSVGGDASALSGNADGVSQGNIK
jgi:hypothetical protein